MHVEYNGVLLELVSIDRVDREAIWTPDGTELLYNEWRLSLSCVYHPPVAGQSSNNSRLGGTAIRVLSNPTTRSSEFAGSSQNPETLAYQTEPWNPSAGTDEGARLGEQMQTMAKRGKTISSRVSMPGFGDAEYAPLTDKYIHQILSIPRRKLKITFGDPNGTKVTWLESPGPGLNSDARHGPMVTATSITSVNGDGVSFGVQLNIVTWIPPCQSGSDRPVLAHRWQMTQQKNEDDYLTRFVEGEIYFNRAILEKDGNKIRADYLIAQMYHPIPLGYRRYLGPVKRSPDGLVISYSYIDVDPTVTFDPGNSEATQMSVVENVMYVPALDRAKAQGIGIGKSFDLTDWDEWNPLKKKFWTPPSMR